MDLDWCSINSLSNTKNFNENLIITKGNKNKSVVSKELEKNFKNVNIDECFNLNLIVKDPKELLTILNYSSLVSNYLRTFIRNKSNKYNEYIEINENEYMLICKYLNWLYDSITSVKNFFSISLRKDNSYDPNNIKLFKTSSYKFCNYKESCLIHKNKNKNKCDKNHFVFDMVVNDIQKLTESINIVGLNNINWVLSNKIIKITYVLDDKKYFIEQINNINLIEDLNSNQFIIDKTLIFKSFDVVSYVLNKMYNESYCFLNFDIESHLIDLSLIIKT